MALQHILRLQVLAAHTAEVACTLREEREDSQQTTGFELCNEGEIVVETHGSILCLEEELTELCNHFYL